ncbi:hypothetical protein H0R94_13030 [Treponema socranskii]|uniref:hypothetical protein n=1 Tax=Treponema socranskii TaxID=53419 RepID=UPI003D8CC1F5
MTNLNHLIQIQRFKNEILNFISKETGTFRFTFLNNKQNTANNAVSPFRADHAGCHCYVQPFTNNGKNEFSDYGQGSSYYITFNEWLDDAYKANMAIRADYLSYLKEYEGNLHNKYFFFISRSSNTIYKISFMSVLSNLKECKKVRKTSFETIDIPVSLAEKSAEFNSAEYKQSSDNSFNPDYFKSIYIGNFTYAKYRNATCVQLFQLATNGDILNQKSFRSIKELYDTIKRWDESDSLKSYKTFQRSVAKGDFTLIIKVKGYTSFLVVSLNETIDTEAFVIEEVVDKVVPNPFFDETQPENEYNNMKTIIVKSHYEFKFR